MKHYQIDIEKGRIEFIGTLPVSDIAFCLGHDIVLMCEREMGRIFRTWTILISDIDEIVFEDTDWDPDTGPDWKNAHKVTIRTRPDIDSVYQLFVAEGIHEDTIGGWYSMAKASYIPRVYDLSIKEERDLYEKGLKNKWSFRLKDAARYWPEIACQETNQQALEDKELDAEIEARILAEEVEHDG